MSDQEYTDKQRLDFLAIELHWVTSGKSELVERYQAECHQRKIHPSDTFRQLIDAEMRRLRWGEGYSE